MRSFLWLSLIETCHLSPLGSLHACDMCYRSGRTGVQRAPRGKWAHRILPEDKGVMKLGHAMAAQRSRRPKSHMILQEEWINDNMQIERRGPYARDGRFQ